MKRLALVTLAATLLYGCSSSSYGIRVVDGLPKETYLTFSKGSPVNVGDVFILYHMQQASASGGGHGGHGGGGGGPLNLKHEVGRVQVVSIADDTHALVRVISGRAEDGLDAERAE
ncbi:MAG: hypothetical protein HY708_05170 [Ignavibacteriae bacterium]|nr:hypothetical protein [Ignavibacteriota bacterium]